MLLLSGGIFADRFGRKRVYLAGVAAFTAASALCSLAPSVGRSIAGRVLQGIGAAALSPASLALLAAADPGAAGTHQSDRAAGRIQRDRPCCRPRGRAARSSTPSAAGIFLVNLPVGVVLLLVGLPALRSPATRAPPRSTTPGTVLSVLGSGR